jgi:putative ABC transport system permease protein
VKLANVVRAAWRESRGSGARLVFFIACLALGVAAITGVSGLVDAIEDALRAQSRDLLGADVSIQARRPIRDELDRYFEFDSRRERAQARETPTLTAFGAKSRLVELKAVSDNFPFYGSIKLEPAGLLGELLDAQSCAVAPSLLEDLGAKLGDELSIGGKPFRIAAVVLDEPGRLDIAFTLGPRVFVTLEGLERTELEQFGSRVRYRELYRLPSAPDDAQLAAVKRRINDEVDEAPYLRIESHREAQPTVRRSLERVESYLGLVALLSLVLGGVGVAQIVRAWVASRTQAVAVLRVLGFRPREVLAMYLGHVALLALVGSTLGALAGSFAPHLVASLAADLLPTSFEVEWAPLAVLRGIALGVGIALVFSAPPLTAIWQVAPARVLCNDVEPLPAPRAVAWGAALLVGAGLFAAALAQSRQIAVAAGFTVALALLAVALSLGAHGLTKLAGLVPRKRLDPYLRNGIAALARPGIGVVGATVALGFGVLVVTLMALVEGRLSERLRNALPTDAPSVFLIDVQPDQLEGVRAELLARDARSVRDVPVVTARLSTIDGVPVRELAQQRAGVEGRSRWVLTREQRLTWMRELPADNKVVEGALWSDPEHLEVSLEQDFASDLGAKLGSVLVFDVQGTSIELRVTSIRTVEWESFGINFFLVAEPEALEQAPHSVLIAARLDADREVGLQSSLAASAPNVTPIAVRAILEKVLAVLTKLALAVRILGLFTVLTGLTILAGVASSTAVHRGREVALLKTLGLTRAGVARLFGIEFALIGLVSGAIGGSTAFALAWVFLERVLEIDADLPWSSLAAATLLTALASALCGIAANARALASRPIESLRA